ARVGGRPLEEHLPRAVRLILIGGWYKVVLLRSSILADDVHRLAAPTQRLCNGASPEIAPGSRERVPVDQAEHGGLRTKRAGVPALRVIIAFVSSKYGFSSGAEGQPKRRHTHTTKPRRLLSP